MRQPPLACFVVGPAGSGKSTVARLMAGAAKACILDKDSLGEEFVDALLRSNGYASGERESNDYYRAELMPLEYRALFRMAADNLALGNTVVIDAPFAAYLRLPEYLAGMRREAGWPESMSVVAHVLTDARVIRQRLASRGLARDLWKLDHWDEFWKRFSSVQCLWDGVRHITITNDDEPDLQPWLTLLD